MAPYVVDNSRCISYLTIENRGTIPEGDATPGAGLGLWLRHLPGRLPCQPEGATGETDHTEDTENFRESKKNSALSASSVVNGGFLDLIELLEMSEDEFRQRFAGTSIMRAKRVGMQRNACVALGNSADELSGTRTGKGTGKRRASRAWACSMGPGSDWRGRSSCRPGNMPPRRSPTPPSSTRYPKPWLNQREGELRPAAGAAAAALRLGRAGAGAAPALLRPRGDNRSGLVVLAEVQLLHLLLDEEKVTLRQQVQGSPGRPCTSPQAPTASHTPAWARSGWRS